MQTLAQAANLAHGRKLYREEFLALCGEHLIDPAIALESDAVCDALRTGDRDAVTRILREEF